MFNTFFKYHVIVFDKNGKFMFDINITGTSLESVRMFLKSRNIEYSYFEIYDIWGEDK